MTQYERAMAGKLFDAHSEELMEKKHKTHVLCQKYNLLAEDDPERAELLRQNLGSMGNNVGFQGLIQFNYGCNTHIGDVFFANLNLTVLDDGPIPSGDHVMIGPNVWLVDSSRPRIAEERVSGWICCNAQATIDAAWAIW